MSGRFIGLPLTTGPFVLIVYLQNDGAIASQTAHGVLSGQVALIIFSWVYAVLALRISWFGSLAWGTFFCLITGAILTSFQIPLYVLLPLNLGIWLLFMRLWPSYNIELENSGPEKWELPARIMVTAILILILIGLDSILGPRLSGALSSYPVIVSVLGVFNHKRVGPNFTVGTLHGVMRSIPISITIMTLLTIVL